MTEPIRLLIADDDALTRVGIRSVVAVEPDIEVVAEAADAREALALTDQLDLDIVLMDVQLPDIDGIEVTRRITERGRERPRVIVLTTFDSGENAFRAIRAGASGFLLKRSRPEEIVDAIRRVANGEVLPMLESARTTDRWAPPTETPLGALTPRETEVLLLLARGLSNAEIAIRLGLSLETVRTHVKHVYAKSGSPDRAHAVIAAYESGLISREDEPGLGHLDP